MKIFSYKFLKNVAKNTKLCILQLTEESASNYPKILSRVCECSSVDTIMLHLLMTVM